MRIMVRRRRRKRRRKRRKKRRSTPGQEREKENKEYLADLIAREDPGSFFRLDPKLFFHG